MQTLSSKTQTLIQEITVSDDQTHRKLVNLSAQEKQIEVQIIGLLQIAIEKKIALQMGHKSLKDYCEVRLNMSEDVSYQRSQTAHICLRFPILFDLLKASKTYISHLRLLSNKATKDNINLITHFLPGKSKRQLEAFLSTLNPDGSFKEKDETVSVILNLSLCQLELLRKAQTILSRGQKFVSDEEVQERSLDSLLDRIDPVRKSNRATLRKEKKVQELLVQTEKLARNQGSLLSTDLKTEYFMGLEKPGQIHSQQKSRPGTEIKTENSGQIHSQQKSRTGTEIKTENSGQIHSQQKSRPGTDTKTGSIKGFKSLEESRYIPAQVRHEVTERDQGQCSFVSPDSMRCSARASLVIDHVIPFAAGGESTVANSRILCRGHNQLLGEQIYGRFKNGITQEAQH